MLASDGHRRLASERPPLAHCVFGLDVRSMAVYRITIGLVIVGDLLDRLHDLSAHYTDTGLLPRSDAVYWGGAVWLNPYLLTGHPYMVFLLFVLHAVIALCMSLGYLCCILFVSIFLPLGKAWSLDALRKRRRDAPLNGRNTYYLSAATAAFLAQVSYVYVYAYYLKTGDMWVTTRDATFYALQMEYFSTGMLVGYLMKQLPHAVLRAMTAAVLAWEGWGPLCYFLPIPALHGLVRVIGVIGFVALHLGFAMALRLGTFFWISVSIQLALLPAYWWDACLPRLYWLLPPLRRLADLAQHRIRARAEALLVQFAQLGVVAGPPIGRQRKHRPGWLAKGRRIALALGVALMASSAIGWNLATMSADTPRERWTDRTVPWASALAIDQNWAMFAPSPPDSDYWLVIKGISPTRHEFEVFREGGLFSLRAAAVSFEPPVPFHGAWYNHRWCKYWEAFIDPGYRRLRPLFKAWLCREWNARHTEPDEQIGVLEVYYMWHQHFLNGSVSPISSPEMIYKSICIKGADKKLNAASSSPQIVQAPQPAGQGIPGDDARPNEAERRGREEEREVRPGEGPPAVQEAKSAEARKPAHAEAEVRATEAAEAEAKTDANREAEAEAEARRDSKGEAEAPVKAAKEEAAGTESDEAKEAEAEVQREEAKEEEEEETHSDESEEEEGEGNGDKGDGEEEAEEEAEAEGEGEAGGDAKQPKEVPMMAKRHQQVAPPPR